MERLELQRLTINDWMQLYSDQGPFELINGEIIDLAPQGELSGKIGTRLSARLFLYVDTTGVGEALSETAFVLTSDSNWVAGSRQPDVAFYSAARWQAYVDSDERDENGPIRIVPDFVAEVISSTDRAEQVQRKIETYLADGVKLIWVIYPQTRTVVIFRAGTQNSETLRKEDTLSGEDIIPGFTLSIDQLFAE